MKLSADTPPDGDFVRYVEGLTAQPYRTAMTQAAPHRARAATPTATSAPPQTPVPAAVVAPVRRFMASVLPKLRLAFGAWVALLVLGLVAPRLAWLQGPVLLGLLAWLVWRVWQDLAGGELATLRQRLQQWAESAKR